MHYLTLIDASSGYHNQKLDINHHTILFMPILQVEIYRLPLDAAQAGDKFQHKINDIFKELPNVLSEADDILIEGYDADSKDHDKMLNEACKHAL